MKNLFPYPLQALTHTGKDGNNNIGSAVAGHTQI
jgi:hypothetical protein